MLNGGATHISMTPGEVVQGLDVILYNLKVLDAEFHAAAERGIRQGAIIYYNKLRQHTTKRCHSLADLRRLGHPYSRRHGKHGRLPGHGYWWQIHRQHGQLDKALYMRGRVTGESIGFGVSAFRGYIDVGFDPAMAEEANYVILGTEKMIARPAPRMVLDKFEKNVKWAIIREMGKAHTFAWGKFRRG